MRDLNDCRLYGILDLGYIEAQQCPAIARQMIQGGVDIIQLRGKEASLETLTSLARELHRITSEGGVPLIVNDHAEVARQVEIEGVHVGQDDDAVAAVRARVGRQMIVGKSTHSLEQARAGEGEGANYIGFGPVFATPTKPDYVPIGLADIAQVHREVTVPIFCIGGIKLENMETVIAAGARRVAIVSGLLQAAAVQEYASNCRQLLLNSPMPRLNASTI